MNCIKYDIIAIIGKSASGKDSIVKEIAKHCNKEVALIRQTTTRPRFNLIRTLLQKLNLENGFMEQT